MPKLSEVISLKSCCLMPFTELCGKVDFFSRPHMHLSCVSSLMGTDCDKSTSPVVTETGCANIFFFFQCMSCFFICSSSIPSYGMEAGTLQSCILSSSLAALNCIRIWNSATVRVINQDFSLKRIKVENPWQSKTTYLFG